MCAGQVTAAAPTSRAANTAAPEISVKAIAAQLAAANERSPATMKALAQGTSGGLLVQRSSRVGSSTKLPVSPPLTSSFAVKPSARAAAAAPPVGAAEKALPARAAGTVPSAKATGSAVRPSPQSKDAKPSPDSKRDPKGKAPVTLTKPRSPSPGRLVTKPSAATGSSSSSAQGGSLSPQRQGSSMSDLVKTYRADAAARKQAQMQATIQRTESVATALQHAPSNMGTSQRLAAGSTLHRQQPTANVNATATPRQVGKQPIPPVRGASPVSAAKGKASSATSDSSAGRHQTLRAATVHSDQSGNFSASSPAAKSAADLQSSSQNPD